MRIQAFQPEASASSLLTEAVLDFPAPEGLSGDCHHMSGSREDGQENHPDCQSPNQEKQEITFFIAVLGWIFTKQQIREQMVIF